MVLSPCCMRLRCAAKGDLAARVIVVKTDLRLLCLLQIYRQVHLRLHEPASITCSVERDS